MQKILNCSFLLFHSHKNTPFESIIFRSFFFDLLGDSTLLLSSNELNLILNRVGSSSLWTVLQTSFYSCLWWIRLEKADWKASIHNSQGLVGACKDSQGISGTRMDLQELVVIKKKLGKVGNTVYQSVYYLQPSIKLESWKCNNIMMESFYKLHWRKYSNASLFPTW